MEGDVVQWHYSSLLEPWVEVYDQAGSHIGTLPEAIFKREFKFYVEPQ